MAGDTGQGQTATIFAQSIPNVQSIEVNNTGEVLRETVADGVLTAALGTGWEFTINFIAPTTGTHTLEGAIKAGESGSITIESGQTKYTSSAAVAPVFASRPVGRVHYLRADHRHRQRPDSGRCGLVGSQEEHDQQDEGGRP
jgi:hypothetical protein